MGPPRDEKTAGEMLPPLTATRVLVGPKAGTPSEVPAYAQADSTVEDPPTSPTSQRSRDGIEDRVTIPPEANTTGVQDVASVLRRVRSMPVRDRHLLVCMQGTFLGRVLRLGPTACTVGRQQGAELWMPDPGVSRAHARVESDGDGFVVIDLDSANGTYVNGERITRHRLADGDLVQLGAAVVLRYLWTEQDHERMLVNLYEASVRDPLTGAFNREHLDDRLRAEVAFCRRHQTEVALAMFDLDHFKQVNDTHGHLVGDRVLVEIAGLVRNGIRVEDLLCRYGGEEFVVVLRNISLPGAVVLAERLRALIASHPFATDAGELHVTASFGCATLACAAERTTEALIDAADRRLLIAKRLGRNRVVSTG